MIWCQQRILSRAGQDVWEHPAAAGSGGAAEEGGQHQEDLRQPGCRGYQGERWRIDWGAEAVYPFTD